MFEELNTPQDHMYFYAFGSVFLMNFLLWLFCQTLGKRDNSWIDVMWGLMFCWPNAVILYMRGGQDISDRMWLVSIPVFVWGLRLAFYIFIRHKQEDYRYKEMRLRWEEGGTFTYLKNSFIFIALMQGLFSIITNASALYINFYSSKLSKPLGATDFTGIAIWALGFGIEVIADSQLASHLANPKPGTGKFIKSCLWRYSRHPNYFGESLLWWGIFLIACGEYGGWVTFFSAAFITWALRYFSGVPFPEKKYASNPEWQQYCSETNVFVLMPVKKNTVNELK